MSNLPSNLPDLLRKHGLKVVEVPGWKTRGRPSTVGGFAPVGVLCHDTVTPKTASVDSVIKLLVDGRSDLPGPLCQLSLGRDGTVYIVAAGRANHAGWAKASGSVAGGDGNVLYIGIEAQEAGTGEPWNPVQYDAYSTLCAALCVEVTHNSVNTVRGHKETSTEGKIDPSGPTPDGSTFDMDKFRGHVAAKIKQMQKAPTPPPVPKPTPAPKPKPTPAPKPLGKTYTGIHASGKYDGNPDEWAAYIAQIAAAHKARWVTGTEDQQKGIAPKMRTALGPEWLVQTQGEYILATRNAEPVGKSFRLFVTTVAGLIGWRQMRPGAFDVKLDGRPFRFYVIHGPSAIENGDKWVVDRRTGKYPPRVLAAQRGWHRLGRRMARFAKSHPDTPQVAAGDTNLDNHRHWLGWLSVAIGAPSVWEGHLPPAGEGTHGARLIDTAHVLGATVVDAQIVPEPRPAGFDHQPLVYKIR